MANTADIKNGLCIKWKDGLWQVIEFLHVKPGKATNSTKPAIVDNGAEIRVPLFINTGDWVKVDTKAGTYSERIKK
jgi:elongation factor P